MDENVYVQRDGKITDDPNAFGQLVYGPACGLRFPLDYPECRRVWFTAMEEGRADRPYRQRHLYARIGDELRFVYVRTYDRARDPVAKRVDLDWGTIEVVRTIPVGISDDNQLIVIPIDRTATGQIACEPPSSDGLRKRCVGCWRSIVDKLKRRRDDRAGKRGVQ